MILQHKNVQLTNVHYYEKRRNVGVSSISREIFENEFNRNIIIKSNVFGHKWVLKVNEIEGVKKSKKSCNFIVYILVFACIVIAVIFGVFYTLERRFNNDFNKHKVLDDIKNTTKIKNNTKNIEIINITSTINITKQETKIKINILPTFNKTFCLNCTKSQICLKKEEFQKPQCHQIKNKKDPTGCGGNCKINTQFCQLLDNRYRVYQCSNMKNVLKCPKDNFNCGNRCINMTKKCDGTVHCSNRSDEQNCECDLSKNFQCSYNTSCISNAKKCDGIIDCWDKTDEMDCNKGCLKTQFLCSNGECIPKDNFCDGIMHCRDGSDEPKGCLIYDK